jgi:HPt (histidine-containing phosphotransfer) domain-containing protein
VIEDIRGTFLHRFTSLARTRLAKSREAAGDPALLGTAVRELHSLAGEAGLLGIADVVPLARRGEDLARKLGSGEPGESLVAILDELDKIIAQLG